MDQEPRILILEDVATDAELVLRELRKAGIVFSSRQVQTREAFLQALKEFAPDIILSDYNLPQFTALDALRLLKQHNSDVPLILVTGSLTEEVAVQCMKEGADDYILKASLKRLPSAVLNALDKQEAERGKERAVAALRESEERYRAVVEQSAEGILLVDAGTKRFLEANEAFLNLFGYTSEELPGLEIYDIIESDRESINRNLERVLKERHVSLGERVYRRKDNSLVDVEVSVNLISYGGREVLCTNIRDITERKKAERALRETEEQLRQSQKLEAVGQLAGGVAHDFNNLLTVINGYTDMLLTMLPQDEFLSPKLEEILKAGQRATSLTRQLLAFSRKQVLQPQVLDPNSLVTETSKMLRRLIGEDIELVMALKSGGHINADPGQIEQVLMNLIVNARDAMPQGGKVIVETDDVELTEDYAGRHVGVQPGGYVKIAVSDTGTGMDQKTQKHIFEPFFTTKEAGKGTGLGLSTVYGIVKQSGGNIWVYSEAGRGTTFKIYLPRVEEEVEAIKPRTTEAALPRGTETVLLVEDEAMVRGLARSILEMNGYRVVEAANGEEALRICERHEGPIDLLLTDVVMPLMSGPELAERLTPLRPGVRVLYMSGYTDDAIVHHGVLDPGTPFLEKPFTPKVLLNKVGEVLGR